MVLVCFTVFFQAAFTTLELPSPRGSGESNLLLISLQTYKLTHLSPPLWPLCLFVISPFILPLLRIQNDSVRACVLFLHSPSADFIIIVSCFLCIMHSKCLADQILMEQGEMLHMSVFVRVLISCPLIDHRKCEQNLEEWWISPGYEAAFLLSLGLCTWTLE